MRKPTRQPLRIEELKIESFAPLEDAELRRIFGAVSTKAGCTDKDNCDSKQNTLFACCDTQKACNTNVTTGICCV